MRERRFSDKNRSVTMAEGLRSARKGEVDTEGSETDVTADGRGGRAGTRAEVVEEAEGECAGEGIVNVTSPARWEASVPGERGLQGRASAELHNRSAVRITESSMTVPWLVRLKRLARGIKLRGGPPVDGKARLVPVEAEGGATLWLGVHSGCEPLEGAIAASEEEAVVQFGW